ncbi:MAG: lysylphosphatidylglycerol synthase transmembrane domain-containing protein [Blastocatellia bacterium]
MRNYLRSLIILLIGGALAYWFISRLEWDVISVHFQRMKVWPVGLAILFAGGTLLLRSFRWQTLLGPITPSSLANVFAATTVGFGSIFVLGRAGEVVRPVYLSLRERIRPSATIATILIERLFDTTTVVTMFSVNLLFFSLPENTAANAATLRSMRLLGLLMTAGVAAGILVLVVIRLKSEALLGWMEKVTARFPEKITRPLLNLLRHLAEGLSVLTNARLLARAVLQSCAVWAFVVMQTLLVGLAFGASLSPGHAIFVMGFGLVGSVVPTPGGSAGAFHKAVQEGLKFLGYEENLSAAIAIVFHLVAFGTPFVMALFYLLKDKISFAQLREMIAEENVAP